MRHSANELIYKADILGADGTTVITPGAACGITDLAGRILEQAQLIASMTTHLIVMRYPDAAAITDSSYILCEGVLYIVDHAPLDPRVPRPRMWLEIYCHVERSGR